MVGINDYNDHEGTRYVQGNKIIECLNAFWLRREEMRKYGMQHCSSALKRRLEGFPSVVQGSSIQNSSSGVSENKNKRHRVSLVPGPRELTEDEPAPELTGDEHKHLRIRAWPSNDFTKMVNDVLKYDGYPLPAYADGGMHLEGDFEEQFGRDILSEPARSVALKMSRCVVALASYNDTERHFACTGVFIDCNESTTRVPTSASLLRASGDKDKIIDNLRIDVCLPSKKCIPGKLQKYDFC